MDVLNVVTCPKCHSRDMSESRFVEFIDASDVDPIETPFPDDAGDKTLLQLNTTPSTHTFNPGCAGGGTEDVTLVLCDADGDDSCSDPMMPPNPTFCLVDFPGFPPPVGMPVCDFGGAPFICIECVDATCFASLGSLLEFRVIDGAGPGEDCFFVGNVVSDVCSTCFVGTPRYKVAP